MALALNERVCNEKYGAAWKTILTTSVVQSSYKQKNGKHLPKYVSVKLYAGYRTTTCELCVGNVHADLATLNRRVLSNAAASALIENEASTEENLIAENEIALSKTDIIIYHAEGTASLPENGNGISNKPMT